MLVVVLLLLISLVILSCVLRVLSLPTLIPGNSVCPTRSYITIIAVIILLLILIITTVNIAITPTERRVIRLYTSATSAVTKMELCFHHHPWHH